ncbi:MAG: hypothetical protein Q9M23_01360 [Mariprofundaceae bacterium]|nr:hypothetical protein [Mariprofundaceae bacterium]
MLSIEHLNLHLPAGFEHRAALIARLVGQELAGMHIEKSAELKRLQVAEISLHQGQSDRQAAVVLARAIHGQMMKASRE